MAILENHFYHKTIRQYSAIFGTIFNDIKIERETGKYIKVPLIYAGQQKQNVRADNENPNEIRFNTTLPRMSFLFNGIQKDQSRSTNKMHMLQEQNVDRVANNGVRSQLNRVPYNFSFQLFIKTKHLDDMLQIIEQILPYFNPSIKVVVKDNPDLDSNTSINISLDDIQYTDDFEGQYEDTRVLETTISFTLEGYLYTASSDSSIIKTVYINYIDILTDKIIDSDIFTEADL